MRCKEKLIGIRIGLATVHPAAPAQAASNLLDYGNQVKGPGQSTNQSLGEVPDGLGRLAQAAVGVMPDTNQDQPVLDYHRNELGIGLAEDTPGVLATRFIHLSLLLP